MSEQFETREEQLRQAYHSQTARIRWHELQVHYAGGRVVAVAPGTDLVEVAVQLGMDNTAAFSAWIDSGSVSGVTEAQAMAWFEAEAELWAVVAAPWVLVQPALTDDRASESP